MPYHHVVCAIVGACLTVSASGLMPQDTARQDLARARERVYPALVNISVVTRYFADGRSFRSPSAGSGVIVTPEGHVLTNYHVAGRSTRIECVLPDGEAIEATVVVHDPLTDLSVLKLRTEKRSQPAKPLPFAPLGDSDKLEIGDYVMALGNPLTLASTLTLGVVSNPRRVFLSQGQNEMERMTLDDGEATGLFTRWIQHDAEIAPGNSGGPLVNLQGEVIGINELRYGGGIGFAIPSNIASKILRQALANGAVNRAWLGITLLPVKQLDRTNGVLVSDVMPGSAADRAGIKPGDIVLKIGEDDVFARFFEEVPVVYQRIADLDIGKPVALQLERSGKPIAIQATPTRMYTEKGDEDEIREVGATVEAITHLRALANRLPVENGVVVTGVRAGFPFEAARPSIRAGDILISVGGKPVTDLTTLRTAIADISETGIGVVFRRRGEVLVTEVKPVEPKEPGIDTELPRAWLGAKVQVLTAEVARALSLPKPGGFRITQVLEGSRAAAAGLQPGDIITAMDAEPLRAAREQDLDDLKRLVETRSVGETVKLTVLRQGAPISIPVVLEAVPKPVDQARSVKQPDLEFTVREIMPIDRMESRRYENIEGVLVSDVTQGGWASLAGLIVGDIVLAVQESPTSDTTAFETAMHKAVEAKPTTLALHVLRGFRSHFVFIQADWERSKPPKG